MEEYTTSRYQVLGKIGEGVHGVVLKAIDLTNNHAVAIKKVSLKNKYGEISLNTLREIKVLQNCECENILALKDLFPDLIGLSLVFEYMPHTLYSRLKDESNPLCRQDVRNLTKMLLKGLKYLHHMDIMHRDIKPANLLISDKGLLKIADFGLARLYHPDDEERCYSPQVASRWYRAPETLWGTSKYGPAIDMWAVGCVFAELLRGVPLFAGNTDIEQLALVVRTLGTPNHRDWPELHTLPDYHKIRFPESKGVQWERIFPASTTSNELDLVNSLVRYNPRHRLNAVEALSHPYIIAGNDK